MSMGDSNKLLVVLDCANIGWNYGKSELFNVHGLELVLDYFLKVSILCKVVAFIPSSYVRYRPSDGTRSNAKMMTEDIDKLESMIKECRISIVPAGDDDDAYILSYAREHQGYILSNDLYNNHLASIENKHVRDIIRNYLNEFRIGYTFVNEAFILTPLVNYTVYYTLKLTTLEVHLCRVFITNSRLYIKIQCLYMIIKRRRTRVRMM